MCSMTATSRNPDFLTLLADFPRQATAKSAPPHHIPSYTAKPPNLQQEIWLKISRPLDLSPQALRTWRRPVDQPCFPQPQLDGCVSRVGSSCKPRKCKVPL